MVGPPNLYLLRLSVSTYSYNVHYPTLEVFYGGVPRLFFIFLDQMRKKSYRPNRKSLLSQTYPVVILPTR